VQATDIDRTTALMCYIQLSLWGVPAQVIVGNTLTNEVREVFYTPVYYINQWDRRLIMKQVIDFMRSDDIDIVATPEIEKPAPVVKTGQVDLFS